jgi:beta-N-acetylhexosaminidase
MFKNIGKLFLIKPEDLEENGAIYRELNFSNFIFFSNHFEEDFDYYISTLKEKTHLRFLAVDQEGGRVCRIKGEYASPLEVAKKYLSEGEEVIRSWAEKIAFAVKNKGLNLNLSPCVDLSDDSAEDFLKSRTFGNDPELVKKLAQIFIAEHKKRGIFTCLKHFPGLKDVKIDPHKELPKVENFYKENLIPYEYLIERENINFVMTTHLIVKELDSKPATFSSAITDILRKRLNYRGAILTDDLNMGALKNWELQDRIILSLASGHNLLIYCGNFENLIKALEDIKNELEKSLVLREKIKESMFILDKIERTNK